MTPVALTIAGSDPTGGAGLQADLKTFHQFGVYGEAVATLITVQNSVRVSRVEVLSAGLVRQQIEAVDCAREATTASGGPGCPGGGRSEYRSRDQPAPGRNAAARRGALQVDPRRPETCVYAFRAYRARAVGIGPLYRNGSQPLPYAGVGGRRSEEHTS